MERDTITIANLILDHYLANGNKYVGVPVKSFEQRKLGHHDVRIALSILTKSGVIQGGYHLCWGHTKIEDGVAFYQEVSADKPKNVVDEDGIERYEAYHLTVEPNALKQFVGQPKSTTKPKKDDLIELVLEKNGDLYKEPKEKFCYQMFEQAERQKILRYFIEQSKITTRYIETDEAALSLEKDKDSLRREIGKINQNAFNRLKIGHKVEMGQGRKRTIDGLIDSKQDSGYRLNPQVKITAK